MSQHIDPADAVDYARGVLPGDRRNAVDSHLATCPDCAALVAGRRNRRHGNAGGRLHPPASAVRLARAVFPPRRTESPLAALPRLVARLLGDTATQPLPVGVRGARSVARHALFEAGGYNLDLRLEEDDAAARLVVVGQVLAPDGTAHPEEPRRTRS